eukprot:4217849-Prymnesium_polylepis.1
MAGRAVDTKSLYVADVRRIVTEKVIRVVASVNLRPEGRRNCRSAKNVNVLNGTQTLAMKKVGLRTTSAEKDSA